MAFVQQAMDADVPACEKSCESSGYCDRRRQMQQRTTPGCGVVRRGATAKIHNRGLGCQQIISWMADASGALGKPARRKLNGLEIRLALTLAISSRRYLTLLGEALLNTGCKPHAYVLMDNHVHLLTTPPEIGAVACLMQKLGRSYVDQFNARHRRTGTLWEGRYKTSLIDSESYVPHCHRYIELNPVRARMTDDPTAYPWSSCASHCGLRQQAILSPHPEYTTLAATAEARAAAYRQLLHETLSDDDLKAIRIYLQQQRALGRDDFRAMVEAKARRFARHQARAPPASPKFKRL